MAQKHIGIIDADLIGRKNHRFPNLACMKISAYHKNLGDDVVLVTSYEDIPHYDHVYISKVFTNTEIPEGIFDLPNISYGGTGFFYDKAPPLSDEIEHSKPDYHLYDDWVNEQIHNGRKRKEFEYYLDYSIGFLTRGCFRQCQFCVNKNYTRCNAHSPIDEFFDSGRPKICLLDDNFFACKDWKDLISDVKLLNRPFQFKQGLDERLLTEDKIREIHTWKYDGDLIFAFDNIEDRDIIEKNLQTVFEMFPDWSKRFKFYVFCGYDRDNIWDDSFWIRDIRNTFERIKILAKYSALPYIMRYERCYSSAYSGVYSSIAAWCNQPSIYKTFTYEMFCRCKGMGSEYKKYKRDINAFAANCSKRGSTWKYYDLLDSVAPEITSQYAHFLPSEMAEYGVDARKKISTT